MMLACKKVNMTKSYINKFGVHWRSEEDKAKGNHFVEAQTMQKDAREENVVMQEE